MKTYLDYNATTPLRLAARAAASQALNVPHNASSVHGYGRMARKMVEDARIQVAQLVNGSANQVIFNSGATEANNTVLKFFGHERILVSAIEHPSVSEVIPHAEKIPVTTDGIVDLHALEKMLAEKKTGLVSIMYANNETGVIQPVQKISGLAKKYGAFFHCDGVQALGKIKVDMQNDGIDFLSLSAHKIGGMQGVGALVLGFCGITPVLLEGGGQEKKARAGTENVAGIAAFGAAAEECRNFSPIQALTALRDSFEQELQKISPEIIIHGAQAHRIPNTSFFSVPDASSETLLMSFDLEGIAVSNGSACSSGTVKPSAVLKAMGCDDATARSALRVSLGWNTKPADVEHFLKVWSEITNRMRVKMKEKNHV